MISVEALVTELEMADRWEEMHGSVWLTPETVDVRRMATIMKSREARLVTIAATELPEGEGVRLDYHWDLQGKLFTVVTKAEGGGIDSIRDIFEAADWVEREIHEYFNIEFRGSVYEPLMLRVGDAPGVNLRKEDE